MVYREVTMLEVKELLRLWLRGVPKKVIARQLGVDVKTVRSYVRDAGEHGLTLELGEAGLNDDLLISLAGAGEIGQRRGEGWDLCHAHRDVIKKYLDGGVRLSKIRKLLARRRVAVTYSTLYRFAVTELDFGRKAGTVLVADGEPGRELQVDTGRMGLYKASGVKRMLMAWIFTAVVSRLRFVYPVRRETTETAIEACEAAWAFYGGVFHVLIPDNTKTIVQISNPLEPTFNGSFLEYSQARGFVIDPARARKPRDKARVEKSVRDTRDDWFGGEEFFSIEAARESAWKWSWEEYGMRRHTRTQRMPREHFDAVERAALLPAPTEPYDIPAWSTPKVARDLHAQVAKALYSIPYTHKGRTLLARADTRTVRFYLKTSTSMNDGPLIKVHPRLPPGGKKTDPEDLPKEKTAYAMRDVNYLQQQARLHGEDVGLFTQALLGTPYPWMRMRQVYALLGLAKRFGAESVNKVCGIALKADMLSVPRLKRMLEIAVTIAPATPNPNVIPIARYLRDPKQYALPFASREGEKNKTGDKK
jgi:transposase